MPWRSLWLKASLRGHWCCCCCCCCCQACCCCCSCRGGCWWRAVGCWGRGAGGGSGGAGKPSPKNWALIAHKIYIFTPSRTSRTPKLNSYFSLPQSTRRVKKDIYAGWYKGCTVFSIQMRYRGLWIGWIAYWHSLGQPAMGTTWLQASSTPHMANINDQFRCQCTQILDIMLTW